MLSSLAHTESGLYFHLNSAVFGEAVMLSSKNTTSSMRSEGGRGRGRGTSIGEGLAG